MKKVCAFAPATIANFNVGFDVLGLALEKLGDHVELKLNDRKENRIVEIINGIGLPTDPSRNSCTVVIQKMQQALGKENSVDVRIRKGFASGSGLGSSSASSAAAAVAFNALMGKPFSDEELIGFAAEGERVACGAAHVDNVAPAIMGGIVLTNTSENSVVRLPFPAELCALTFFPKVKINTADARAVLKDRVPISIVSQQLSYMAMFISSLYEKDLERFKQSMKDIIVEPSRSSLIPKFNHLKQIAMEHDALAFGISGSGPSVFAITTSEELANKIGVEFEACFEGSGIEIEKNVEQLNACRGARITNFKEDDQI